MGRIFYHAEVFKKLSKQRKRLFAIFILNNFLNFQLHFILLFFLNID